MTDTSQKLREALSELMSIVSIHQKATGNNFAWAEMDFAREALALPTADHIPDAWEMVVDHLPDAGKMIETAAPVGELPELPPPVATAAKGPVAFFVKWTETGRPLNGHLDLYTADQMRAYARAALRAGDAVDGPLIDEGSKPALSPLSDKAAIALIEEHTNDENVIHAHEAIDLIRSVERAHGIDAAMRKGQL